jgi:transcriptional regulator with XRE-family HTH domain
MKQLGEVINCWRTIRRMGVREAAKIIGISHSTLSRVENGKPADGKTVVRLLDWLLHDRPSHERKSERS